MRANISGRYCQACAYTSIDIIFENSFSVISNLLCKIVDQTISHIKSQK